MNVLRQPYPIRNSIGKKTVYAFAFGFFVFGFLALLQPFGIQVWEIDHKLLVLAGYGAITTGMMLLNFFFFPAVFPAAFRDESWKVWKEMAWALWNVLSIGAVNLLYSHFIGITRLNWAGFINYQVLTLLVGIFPVAILVLLNYNYQLRMHLAAAGDLSRLVEKEPVQSGGKREMLFLEAENGKDYLQIPLDGLLFIASADNYVEVYWESEGTGQKELLRNTLKNLSRELTTHSQLFRCHRSYLVNLEKVEKVTGNSQGYKLHIGSHVIPVSRNHNTAIKNRLRDIYQG